MSLSKAFNVFYRTKEQVQHAEAERKQLQLEDRYNDLVGEFRQAFLKGNLCLVKVFEPDCPTSYAEQNKFKETLEYMKQKDPITVQIEKYRTEGGDNAARYCMCYNKN
jgi:hypothetical protein